MRHPYTDTELHVSSADVCFPSPPPLREKESERMVEEAFQFLLASKALDRPWPDKSTVRHVVHRLQESIQWERAHPEWERSLRLERAFVGADYNQFYG